MQADFIDRRNFDSFIPHDVLLEASLQEAHVSPRSSVFPGTSVCAETGVVPIGPTATSHFHVVGTVTGRRANELRQSALYLSDTKHRLIRFTLAGVLLPQDAISISKRWSSAPIPEKDSVVLTYPAPILDVKVRATPAGEI